MYVYVNPLAYSFSPLFSYHMEMAESKNKKKRLAFLLYLCMCTITTNAVVPGYGAHSPVTVSKQGARPPSLAPTVVQCNHFLSLRSIIIW